MFCSNCGKQIPDNVNFCPHCGAKLQASSNPNPKTVEPQPSTPKTATQKTKKKPNVLVVAGVALCAFLLGKLVIAPSMTPDSDKTATSGQQSVQIQQDKEYSTESAPYVTSAEYGAIFDDTYIIHLQPMFNMESASFATKLDDGIICCADYGYQNDIVKQWVETIYLPVSEYTDEQKAALETAMKEEFASTDALNCCSVSYYMGNNYFSVTCSYSNVDVKENYNELYQAQLLEDNTFISMSATETSLLSEGFVKK